MSSLELHKMSMGSTITMRTDWAVKVAWLDGEAMERLATSLEQRANADIIGDLVHVSFDADVLTVLLQELWISVAGSAVVLEPIAAWIRSGEVGTKKTLEGVMDG